MSVAWLIGMAWLVLWTLGVRALLTSCPDCGGSGRRPHRCIGGDSA